MKADSVRDAAMLWHGSTRPPSLVRGCCRFVDKEAPKQGTARDEIGLDRKSLRSNVGTCPKVNAEQLTSVN